MANVKTGITLFSLGSPYIKGELDLEGVIRTAAEMGAEGYEIVATQMIPSYPYVSDEFLEFINECEKKYGIRPICYSANMDRGMLKDRDLTEDEMVARAITDIISANKLGCTVMREQYLLSPHGLERIAPYAEAYNVRVGIEIHNPESPITQSILDYVEVIEKQAVNTLVLCQTLDALQRNQTNHIGIVRWQQERQKNSLINVRSSDTMMFQWAMRCRLWVKIS